MLVSNSVVNYHKLQLPFNMRDKPRNYPIDVYFSYNRRDNPDNLPSGFFITVNKKNNPGNLPSGVYSSTARGTFWVG